MLTQGESVEAHALRERGWSVSAIARHLGRDRKTVRAYLSGEREPGRRRPAGPDRFAPFGEYCRIRFGDDRHLWATALFEEVAALGYEGAYSSFTRALRRRGLRPSCDACAAAGTPSEFAVIGHPAGGETQWDWVELPGPPASWGRGRHAHLLRAVALRGVAGGARGVGGAAVPGRVAARGLRAAGRGDPPVAVRPDEHSLPSGDRGRDRVVRRGREVLRGLPRVFRTGELRLIHATSCRFRYSLWTFCGVR